MPPTTDPELVGRTLQVLQPLLLHPEPLVWVHAARALGRLTGALEQMEGTLLDWVLGESRAAAPARDDGVRVAARRAAQVPREPARRDPRRARRGGRGCSRAVAAATPYLFFERRDLWDRLAARILAGDGGAIAARALARGLATLWRRGAAGRRRSSARSARSARWRAARAPDSLDESRRWIEVIAVTDVVDGAERDPLDLELGLENLMRIAAQYDDEEADARAARFAGLARADVPRGAAHRARRRAGSASAPPRSTRSRAARARSRSACGGRCSRRVPRASRSRSRTSSETWKVDRARARPRSSISCKERRQSARRAISTSTSRSRCSRSGSAATRSTRAARTATSGPAAARPRTTRASGCASSKASPTASRELPPRAQERARARSSGASSTRRAARRSARSTTCAGSARSPRGGRS